MQFMTPLRVCSEANIRFSCNDKTICICIRIWIKPDVDGPKTRSLSELYEKPILLVDFRNEQHLRLVF